MRVLCIVGDSGTGKTTLIERLTVQPAFAEDRLGLLKRTHHHLDWHPPGKDSTRFRDTRASVVAVVDPVQTLCFWRRERDEATDGGQRETRNVESQELQTQQLVTACLRMGGDVDVVLAEGFTNTTAPKLWVTRNGPSPERRGPPPVTRTIVTTGEHIDRWAHDCPTLDVVDMDDIELVARRAREHAINVRQLAHG